MALELYLDLFSQPCRSVYIFAKKNNISFDFKKLSLLDGQQYGEDFGKISLIRKVPALRDGDFCLAESVAIMLYLAEKFKTPDFWYPADLRQRARVNEYLSWQHTAIRMHGSKIFWLRVRSPSLICVGAVRLVMSYLSSLPFIGLLAQRESCSEPLSAWRDRVQEAVGKELFDEAHQYILGAQESVKSMDSSKMQVYKPKILRLFM
uniref:Glutathione S-transferase theta 1b n=1 Tax=Neolamprologus brichardi TaxID=32507 RepID=A0A3Q4HAF5_NEOBR